MPEIDNLLGSTRRVVEEQEPLNNCRGVTYMVLNVGGGGGGSVDYTKVVSKIGSMPVASADNADIIYLYDGETDANYTHGYIYENVATTTSSSASAAQTVGSGLSDITVDLETLESFTGWTTDNSLQIFYTADGWSVDTTSLGVTYTGTPNVGDAITITYTAAVTTYAWTRVDVQPAGSSLPSQTGNAGKVLVTDGTDASWGGSIESLDFAYQSSWINHIGYRGVNGYICFGVLDSDKDYLRFGWDANNSALLSEVSGSTLGTSNAKWTNVYTTTINNGADITVPSSGGTMIVNTATASNALTVGGTATTYTKSINIGNGSQAKSTDCVVIGTDAYSTSQDGVAIGGSAIADTAATGATAIGNSTQAKGSRSTAIGYIAKALAAYSIQLGKGTNNTPNAFCVGNNNGNFELMDANGNLPADRIADTTGLTAGNYKPRLTIDAQGNKTITWVAE